MLRPARIDDFHSELASKDLRPIPNHARKQICRSTSPRKLTSNQRIQFFNLLQRKLDPFQEELENVIWNNRDLVLSNLSPSSLADSETKLFLTYLFTSAEDRVSNFNQLESLLRFTSSDSELISSFRELLDRGTASSSFSQPKSGELKLFHDQIVTSIPEEFRTNYFSSLIYRFSSTHEFELLSTLSPTLNDSYEIKQVSQAFAEGSAQSKFRKSSPSSKQTIRGRYVKSVP